MDDPSRSVAKRQIARLLGSASTPFCVLSEEDTLVFANEAMGQFVGRSPESLLGLQCHSEVPADGFPEGSLTAFFALPAHWTRKELKLIPESGRLQFSTEDSASASTLPSSTLPSSTFPSSTSSWIRCLIPLEQDGCILCAFCPTSRVALNEILDEQVAMAQEIMRTNRSKYLYLDDLWYLQGQSAVARRALEQVQLAIANPVSLTVFGPMGSGRSWLAQTIHSQRRKLISNGRTEIGGSMVRIDCSLMDNELLASMLEVVAESTNHSKPTSALLLDSLECLPEECVAILASFFQTSDRTVCLATCDASAIPKLLQKNALWSRLFARTGILRIDLPMLVDRIGDIAILVNAWFDSQPKSTAHSVEITGPFLDALTAYSWPGGVEELAETLAYACKNIADGQLSEKDLPVNIRTYVSHIEQTTIDASVDLDSILEEVERTMILRAMEKFPQNKSSAAKLLNISRARLLRRLQQWGIQSESTAAEVDDDTPDFSEVE